MTGAAHDLVCGIDLGKGGKLLPASLRLLYQLEVRG